MAPVDIPTAALERWRALLGVDQVFDSEAATGRYTTDTSSFRRRIAGAVRVRDARQLAEVVRIAQQHQIPLYAVSRGNNWGYGTANPVFDGAVIVDLSAM